MHVKREAHVPIYFHQVEFQWLCKGNILSMGTQKQLVSANLEHFLSLMEKEYHGYCGHYSFNGWSLNQPVVFPYRS